ncbi:glyoxalase [Brumimicrobium mesophilum]|uniref:glyoxalase n=1 Tax=Brumimicrobium mesophilum TaxID=392717 RepID=UPI000D142B2A|nr:glyoxalase [Brumimicrobium mesophilum]
MKTKNKRPYLPDEILEGISSPAEDFQNKIIRPIIKMQSDLLIAHLKNQLKKSKIQLDQLPDTKKEKALADLFSKNQAFKREINGMVIGHFTLEEYNKYLDFSKEINRRITQIVLNRCTDLILNR